MLEILVWTILTATAVEMGETDAWYPLWGSWIINTITDITISGLELLSATPFKRKATPLIVVFRCTILVLRSIVLILPLLLYVYKYGLYQQRDDEEATSLLRPADMLSAKSSLHAYSTYGSSKAASDEAPKGSENDAEFNIQYATEERQFDTSECPETWLYYPKRFSVFFQLLWPAGETRVQITLLGVLICLVADRIVLLLMVRQLGILIDSIIRMPEFGLKPSIQAMLLFLLYRFLGPRNTISGLTHILWLPFEQRAISKVEAGVQEKTLLLSRDLQTHKSSREFMRSLDQGMNVIMLVKKMACHVIPGVLDLLLMVTYVSYVFGPYVALVLCITTTLCIWFSKHSAAKSVNAHRELSRSKSDVAQMT